MWHGYSVVVVSGKGFGTLDQTKPIHIHTHITHNGTYHSQVRQYAGILCELSRIAFEIFVRSKLSGIDKDRRNHHVIVASCLTDQR